MRNIVIIMLLLTFTLIGCDYTGEPIEPTANNKYAVKQEYIDPDTGVHYLYYGSGYGGGLSVRYNADGTIMVD